MKKAFIIAFCLMAVTFSALAQSTYPADVVVRGMTFRIPAANIDSAALISVDFEVLSGVVDVPQAVLYDGGDFTVRKIHNGAFYDSEEEYDQNFTKVILPPTVSVIGANAFKGCYSLTELPDLTNVKEIGNSAFAYCSGINGRVTLPSNIQKLGNALFDGCSGITYIYYNCLNAQRASSSTTTSPFKGTMSNLKTLEIGQDVQILAVGMFGFCAMNHVILSSNVSEIGSSMFANCNQLDTVTISATVNTVLDNFFGDVGYMSQVNVWPASQVGIGSNSFAANSIDTVFVPTALVSAYQGNSAWLGTLNTSIGAIKGISASRSYSLSVASATAGGSVSGSATGVAENTIRAITATPSTDYRFVSWSDGNRNATRNVTVVSNMELKAYFASTVVRGIADTACNSYTFDNTTYTSTTTVFDTIIKNENDTTIYEVNIVIRTEYHDTINQILNDTVFWRGDTLLAPGFYSDTVVGNSAANICDSIYTIHLTTAANMKTVTVRSAQPSMGYASVDGGSQVPQNSAAVIRASAYSGYRFVQWNDGSTANPRTIIVTRDTTFVASFAQSSLTVTVLSNQPEMGMVGGGGQCARGAQRTITATPFPGYRFVRWNDGDTTPVRVITVMSDITFSATFEPRRYNVTLMTGNYMQGSVTGGGTYDYRTLVTLRATPRGGFVFSHWSDGDQQNPRQLQVTSDIALTAYFTTPNGGTQHHLVVVSANAAMGSVSGTGYYADSTSVLMSAEAADGYRFTAWNDGVTANPRSIMLTSDTMFTAFFEAYTVPATYTITVSANDGQLGAVSGGGTFDEGDTIVVVAYPASRCHLMRWSDGNADNPRTIIVAGDMNLTAMFAHDSVTINVEAADDAMGTVSGGGTYKIGTEITITATPKAGYRFSHWNTADGTNPLTVTAVYSRTYVAIFESLAGVEEASDIQPRAWSDGMSIRVDGCEGQRVRVYDVAGRLIVDDNNVTSQRTFAVGESGVYMVVVNKTAIKVVVLR